MDFFSFFLIILAGSILSIKPGSRRRKWSNVISHILGPKIHPLVTDIQVNVYIGNTLSRLSFRNWRMLEIK